MVKEILVILATDDWLIGDEDIDFAKGKYELPSNWKEAVKNRKRWR